MKRIYFVVSVLALVMMATAVFAAPVAMNFGDITTTQDVTIPNPAATVSGVTISYDDFGSGSDSAIVDSSGIFGSTAGLLRFDFGRQSTTLNLSFTLLDAIVTNTQQTQLTDALTVLFFSGGSLLDSLSITADFTAYDSGIDPMLGLATGAFGYSGAAFDQVQMFFTADSPYFTVDSASFTPVPEPGTLLLLAAGLLGMGGWRALRRIR